MLSDWYFWPWVKFISPNFAFVSGDVANKSIAWFMMIMVALSAGLFRGKKVASVYQPSVPKVEDVGKTPKISPPSINMLDPIFTRQRISINDFYRVDFKQWEGKTFIGCEIIGPGPLILNGNTTLNGTQIQDCDFVKIKVNHPISIAIAFNNTNFVDCYFHRVVIYVPEYMAGSFDGMAANWITL